MHGMQHASLPAGPFVNAHRCTQRDLRTVQQQVMPCFPLATIPKSNTGRNRAAAHVPSQPIVHNAKSMARVIENAPP